MALQKNSSSQKGFDSVGARHDDLTDRVAELEKCTVRQHEMVQYANKDYVWNRVIAMAIILGGLYYYVTPGLIADKLALVNDHLLEIKHLLSEILQK